MEEKNELGKVRKFEYEGQVPVKKTDRNGRVTVYEFDDFGRPTAEKWLDKSGKEVRTIAYKYDESGDLIEIADPDGTQKFGYDELDRNTKIVQTIDGLEKTITFENKFDDASRRTEVKTMIGNVIDNTNSYKYDVLGRAVEIAQEGQSTKQVNYSYNAAGQRTSLTAGFDGQKVYDTLYEYDGLGRLTDLTHQNGEKIFADYDLSWDVTNRITGFDFTYSGKEANNAAEYGYDKTLQLTNSVYNGFQSDEKYEYDANGNRKIHETGKNNQLTNDGEFSYKYDDEGNRIEKKSLKNTEKTVYEWDYRNRLVKVVTPKDTVNYVYDFKNRMIKWNGDFVVHDGWQIALICDSKGNVSTRNLWGANQDELLCENDSWTLCDHLGTVRDAVDETGKVVSHLEYNAFGNLLNVVGDKSLFRYTGKLFDNQTQLQWNVNRWYDANAGRWMSEDFIGFEGKDLNLGRYVGNTAPIMVDHLGQTEWKSKLISGGSYSTEKPNPPQPWGTINAYKWWAKFSATPRNTEITVYSSSNYTWQLPISMPGHYIAFVNFGYEITCDDDGEIMINNINDSGQSGYNTYLATAIGAEVDRWAPHRAKIYIGFAAGYSSSSNLSVTIGVSYIAGISVTYSPGATYSSKGEAIFEYKCSCS